MMEYLLEIRSADADLSRPVKRLASRLFEDLMGRGLGPAEIVTGVTPRRFMVCLKGLPAVEPDREERQLGPPVAQAYGEDGTPTEALRGFAARVGAAPEDLRQVQTERGTYLGMIRGVVGRPVAAVLSELVPRLLAELKWGPPALRQRGLLRGLLSLLDGEVLAFELDGVTAAATTVGHPVLSPQSFEVEGFGDYCARLCELGIEVGLEARRGALEGGLRRLAAELGGELDDDAELLGRLTAQCEIPGVVHGTFDAEYLTLPEEVIKATLSQQQRAFTLRRKGDLLPFFLTVMDRADDPAGAVRAGQERAAAGRFIDTRFRYDAGLRLALAERSRRLEDLDFHPRLGSYAAKAVRLQALVELVCRDLDWQDALEPARQAALLLKADLTCRLVRDLPSLRGTLGGLYARQEGYVEAVWQAIYDHYRPRSASGPIPRHRAGCVVAVADRLDTLVGLFAVAEAPSGSKDPYALRRLTQGLLRIVVEAGMELDLDLVAARAVLLYGELLEGEPEDLLRRLQAFLADRVSHLLGQRGFAHDEIEAGKATGANNLPLLVERVRALKTVREEPNFRSLVLAAKRILNIVKDSPEFELRADELSAGAERELYEALAAVRERVGLAAEERRFEDCLRAMAELSPPLDRFFADVLVMDENESLRENRLALLQSCRRLFWRVARLNEMVVEKAES